MNPPRLTTGLIFLAALGLPACNETGAAGVLPAAGRSPTFRYVKAKEGGCGNLFLYKGTIDGREVLWISADKKKLGLPDKGSKTFDLATAPAGLLVAVDLWVKAPRFRHYCNDIADDTKKEATWHAKKGKLTITILGSADAKQQERYKASARLEDMRFEDDAGHQATLPEATITEVLVGWYAG